MFEIKSPYFGDENMLSVVTADNAPITDYLQSHREQLHRDLIEYGAVLLRGFSMASAEDFSNFAKAVFRQRASYTGGAGLRREVLGKSSIYSTSYTPPSGTIFQHKELAYTNSGPDIVMFFCVRPSLEGGQTPITNFASVYRALAPDTRAFFENRRLVAISYFLSKQSWITKLMLRWKVAFGMTWEDSFGTDNLDDVVQACSRMNKRVRILREDRIVVSELIPAVSRHPVHGEVSWYANAYYDPRLFRKLLSPTEFVMHKLVDETYPIFYDLRLEDGKRVPYKYLLDLHRTTLAKTRMFDWRAGDCMIIDNRQVAHGRTPYRGSRQVLVTMGAFNELIGADPSIFGPATAAETAPELQMTGSGA